MAVGIAHDETRLPELSDRIIDGPGRRKPARLAHEARYTLGKNYIAEPENSFTTTYVGTNVPPLNVNGAY